MNSTIKGTLSLLHSKEGGAARLALYTGGDYREIRLNSHDKLVIRDGNTVVYDGAVGSFDYRTNRTILNARHIGQLFPWPEGGGYSGNAFIHGAPGNIPTEVWLNAILKRWSVELTPTPRLLADDEAAEGELLVSGVMEGFCEQGTEGTIWSVYDPRKVSYDGLNPLQNGDHLTVYEPDGVTIRWKGTVRFDYSEYHHGYQRRMAKEDWVALFRDNLPCLLRRKPKRCKAGKASGKPGTCGSCACDKTNKNPK